MENSATGFSTFFVLVGSAMSSLYGHLQEWLMLAGCLVFLDLRFGIKAAEARGEEIRFSRAWRRTLNKCIDYLGYVAAAEMLSRTFGTTLGSQVVSKSILFLIYGIELSSVINNYFEYKCLPWRIDLWGIIRNYLKFGKYLKKKK